MKKIEAIIRPTELDKLKSATKAIGVSGLVVVPAKGCGHEGSVMEMYRSHEYDVDYRDKLYVFTVVEDEMVEATVDAIMQAARTGRVGDGKIFVSSVEQVYRIRTGDKAELAL